MFRRIRFKIKIQEIYLLILCLVELFGIILLFSLVESITYYQMAILSIFQLIIHFIILKMIFRLEFISIPNMFILFTFIFHCGEILKYGFNIDGVDYFPIELYASYEIIVKSFLFYLFAQIFLILGVGMSVNPGKSSVHRTRKFINKLPKDTKRAGRLLFWIGVFPRLFIDFFQLYISSKNGYMSLFQQTIPQFVNTLAFFFDTGVIFLLMSEKDRRKSSFIFWGVFLYKAMMMLSGSRQDKVCFLLVWVYLYFFVKNKLNIRKMIYLIILSMIGFSFISSIGAGRVNSNIEFNGISHFIESFSYTLGSSLSEFGSAFNTLALAIRYTPATLSYGYGLSFLAAIVSCIPLVVSRIPFLADKTIFLTQLSDSIYHSLGGSYLGELFYNFSWVGIVACIIIGSILGKAHYEIRNKNKSINTVCFYASIATAMFLYVRGYITDMGQKLIWMYIFLLFIRYLEKKKDRSLFKIMEN